MSIKAMNWAWEQSVGSGTKLVLLAIADRANDEGLCGPGHETLAYKCGVTDRAIRAALARLELQGLVLRDRPRRQDGAWAKETLRLPFSQPPEVSSAGGPPEVSSGGSQLPVATEQPTAVGSSSSSSDPKGSSDSDSDPPTSKLAEERELRRLFELWLDRCRSNSQPRPKLSPERRSKLRARLRDSKAEEIELAIEGAALAAYTSPEGKRYDDLELICRNRAKLEDFIERALRHKAKRSGRSEDEIRDAEQRRIREAYE